MIASNSTVFELNKGFIPAGDLVVGDIIACGKYSVGLTDGTIVPADALDDIRKMEFLQASNWDHPDHMVEVQEIVRGTADSYYNYYGHLLTGDHIFLEDLFFTKPISEARTIAGAGAIIEINEHIDTIAIKTTRLKPNTKKWFKIYSDRGTTITVSGEIG